MTFLVLIKQMVFITLLITLKYSLMFKTGHMKVFYLVKPRLIDEVTVRSKIRNSLFLKAAESAIFRTWWILV